MTSKIPRLALVLGLAASSVSMVGLRVAYADTVGAAGAVNTQSTGTPPGQTVRTIEIGAQVVRNEKITTSSSGSLQIVFIDKTTLNVGASSTLVIDEFVYSPAEATGHMTLSLGKGVLRVVGGQATHTGGATVTTAVATIGIRGAIATLTYCPAGGRCGTPGLVATNHFGTVQVTDRQGQNQTISRPGFSVAVNGGGEITGPPFRATQAQIDQTNALVTSKGSQNGGTDTLPTDALARQQGLGRFNAALNPAFAVPRQGQTVAYGNQQNSFLTTGGLTTTTQRLFQTSQGQTAAIRTAASRGLSTSSGQTSGTSTPPISASPPPIVTSQTPPKIPVLAPAAFALMSSVDSQNLGQGNVPYLTASFVGTGSWNVSPILGYRAGGSNPDAFTGTTSRLLQAGISISGTGAAQSSGLFVATGVISNDSQYGFTLTGGYDATSRPRANRDARDEDGAISSPANMTNASAGSVPVDSLYLPSNSFAVNQNTFATDNASNTHVYQARSSSGSNGQADYQFNQTYQPTTAPVGLGTDHPDETLQGYVGGTAQTTNFSPLTASGTHPASAFVITNATGQPGDVTVALVGNSSRMGASFNVVNSTASNADVFHSATLNFGYLGSGNDGAREAYVDSRNFAARSSRTFTGNNGSYTASETSTINGAAPIIDQVNDSLHLLMVTSDTVLGTSATVHTSSLFPGVSFCACDYTRWGFWSLRSYQQNTAGNYGNLTASNIAMWVAGLPAGASDVPTIGTATYNGHVIASISNNGSQYISASNFQNVVNFGTRGGVVSVPSLDGAAFSGTVNFNVSNPAQFGGTIPGTLGRSMVLNGAFFKSATSPVGEMGGAVTVNGTNYLGGGIFAAHGR